MSIEFEKKLAYELSELGIHVQANFQVPDTDLIIDFYIKAPIRGLIEIKGYSFDRVTDEQRSKQLKNISNKFNKSICSTGNVSWTDRFYYSQGFYQCWIDKKIHI